MVNLINSEYYRFILQNLEFYFLKLFELSIFIKDKKNVY